MSDQPISVVQALSRVMADLPAIGKDDRAPANMGGYAFRGIEAMTRAIQPLLAKHGVIIVPKASIGNVDESPGQAPNAKGLQPWQDTYLTVGWTIYGPDGSSIEAQTVGIGRDHLDKGGTKAMTQAFKYLLLQLFCVSDARDDGDGHDYSQGDEGEGEYLPPFGAEVFTTISEQAKGDPRLAALLRQFAIDHGKPITARVLVDDEDWARTVLTAMNLYLTEREAKRDAMLAEVQAEAAAHAATDVDDAPPGAVPATVDA